MGVRRVIGETSSYMYYIENIRPEERASTAWSLALALPARPSSVSMGRTHSRCGFRGSQFRLVEGFGID